MGKKTIGIFVGSARRDSFSKKIALAIAAMMPADFEMKMIAIDDLPLFNQDYDDDNATPEPWLRFREQVKALDGFLFVTPEYNRSMPPLLKNALDIASRPAGHNLWNDKPGAIFGVSPGGMGAFGSVNQLRQTLAFLNIHLLQQPEIYLANITNSLDEHGEILEKTTNYLEKAATAFAAWVNKFVS